LSTTSNLYIGFIKNRLIEAAETFLEKGLYSCRRGHNSKDTIFYYNRVWRTEQKKMYFLDHIKAYNSMDRDRLWDVLENYNFN
jgi:hypothetical protein